MSQDSQLTSGGDLLHLSFLQELAQHVGGQGLLQLLNTDLFAEKKDWILRNEHQN